LNNLVKSEIRAVGLQNNIHLLGRIDQAYRFMAAADIVTLTSRWEGLPYSLLEAMACAKPVVSTAVNGCKELVIDGETGFLVDVGDACSWADRVNQLIANQQLAQAMGSAGRLRVETKYSLAEMISQIERAYLSELI
jgi:glycosyltransferase involved in cell wall biosynthesis